MIRIVFASALSLAALVGPVWADQCQDDVAKIDEALQAETVDADVRTQAEDMRSQAVQLCGAGNLDEGVAVASEVLALLNVE
jgi:ACT domain-containing protein